MDHSGNIEDAQTRLKSFLESLPAQGSGNIIANNIRRIPEAHLLLMFRTVACFGLDRWAPDLLQGETDTMYNLLHEHIAILTFEQVATGYGYSHMGINLSLLRDFSLMRRIYRSFVFSYMLSKAKKEQKSPGSVVKSLDLANVYRRRDEVSIIFNTVEELLY